MLVNLKHSIVFVFILTAVVISFNGSLNSETNNTAALNPNLLDTITIQANPGPSNNGGSSNWAMFFDLIAGSRNISVTQMTTGNTASASGGFNVEVFTRNGTALGGPVGSGPGSSSDGWTSLGIVPVTQGPTTNGVSLVFTLPTISVLAFDTVGVAIKFMGAGPRYFGTGTPPYSTYADTNLTLITGDGRSAPFTPSGSWFASRAMVGEIRYVISQVTSVGNTGNVLPSSFKLRQNFPNPFNPVTRIQYSIPENSFVTLVVFDYLGREVQTLFNGVKTAGIYETSFNGSSLSSGVYYYRLTTEKFTDTKKMILTK